VLTKVAQILKSSLDRKSDLCFRLGGEEFLIIVSTTTAEDAHLLAEKVCKHVASAEIGHVDNGEYGHITVSIGVASVDAVYSSKPDDILHSADQALYEAKEMGRNRVVSREHSQRLEGG